MKLSFYGAAHEVTGSCFYLEACGKHILIDCGMEQGSDQFENQEFPLNAAEIDCVLLTHAHIDHSGNLPSIYAKGFRGEIYSTHATYALCDIMLKDSAHIQQFEAEWKNRKAKRSEQEKTLPAYTMEDVLGVLGCFKSYEYENIIDLYSGIKIRFIDAGHLLGSSSIEVWITEGPISKKIVFSGDIGNSNQPLIHDPHYITEADYVVMESTYGDRTHGARPDYVNFLANVLQKTFDKGGNVIIPSFAVGRTQEILYFIRQMKENNLIKGHANFPVYVDSPLAIEATNIFNENTKGYFDEEAMALIDKGINPISFPDLHTTTTSDESKQINFIETSKVIISASGMCDAGRIRHHLKHNLWRNDSTVVFVGYQAEGTLGRILLDGVKKVKLFGEEIKVNATIVRFEGISAHADKDGLVRWLQSYEKKPERVFIVHGQDAVCNSFAEFLSHDLGYNTSAPYGGELYDLQTNVMLKAGIKKKPELTSEKQFRKTSAFQHLVDAGQHLIAVITSKKDGANKDLIQFTDQINSLSNKWEK